MSDFFFGGAAVWFAVPALIGTGVFMIRSLLMVVGGDTDVHHDFDLDLDGADLDAGHHGDSGDTFQLISVQSLFAMLMGFGWAGFGAIRGMGWGMGAAIPTALLGGLGTVWLLGKLFTMVYRLQSKGNIDISQALELEGSVYIQIPARGEGKGKVRVVINDHERYLKAVSEGDPISPRTAVRVIGLDDEITVVVAPLGELPAGKAEQD